jgi:Flp pilus assembly protein TadG
VRKLKSQRGAAAVEFALIAPLLFMLIFGITEFGLAWSQKEVFIQAAREGARYAAVGCEEEDGCAAGDVATRVENAAVGYDITGSISVSPDPGCSRTDSSDTVTVSWSQDFSINIPFIPPVNVSSPISAVFRCEV